jgi:N-acetylglucosaminyl-diphospho-decaprenol L-rhamnosyltransferase
MKICAIVLNYRDAERTETCLRSLIGQGIALVLVVDNSADAPAADALAVEMKRLCEDGADFHLQILTSACNLGFAHGVNTALNSRHAHDCDLFLLINNDATAMPGMVGKLMSAMGDHDNAIVTPTLLTEDGLPQPELWYQRFFGLMTLYPLPGAFVYPSGCCLMFGRELLSEGKLLDEDFFMYGEDTLLGWHLSQHGKKAAHLKDAYVRHSGTGSSRQYGLFYEYHMNRAHVLLAIKTCHSWLEIPLLLACKSIGILLRAAWRSLRRGSAVPLLAFLLAWMPLKVRPDYGKRSD